MSDIELVSSISITAIVVERFHWNFEQNSNNRKTVGARKTISLSELDKWVCWESEKFHRNIPFHWTRKQFFPPADLSFRYMYVIVPINCILALLVENQLFWLYDEVKISRQFTKIVLNSQKSKLNNWIVWKDRQEMHYNLINSKRKKLTKNALNALLC